jgi:hypothetical protein
MAYPEFVHCCRRERSIYRLNAHKLAPVSIQIGLEWAAISGFQQQLSPWITRSQDDLVNAAPGHQVDAQAIANPKTRPVGTYVAACQNGHYRNGECQNAKQRQSMRQREQYTDLSGQQQPADGTKYAECEARDDRDHPDATRSRDVAIVIEILISHWE